MPRQRRIIIAGGFYHIIQRGIEHRQIFIDDSDRSEFLRRLEIALRETQTSCLGWALMPNHFHLIIKTGKKPISDLMRKLLTGYAGYFNWRHKRVGHLYQNRYKGILCDEEAYLLELVRYVHLNPLRGGIVRNMDELCRYKWCGHGATAGKRKVMWQNVDEVLERFGNTCKYAQLKYRQFVAEGQKLGRRDEFSGGGLKRSAGGPAGIRALNASGERWLSDERILGDGGFVEDVLKQHEEWELHRERLKRLGWDIDRLTDYVCSIFKVRKEGLKRKGRSNSITQAKSIIVYWAKHLLGVSGADIGELLGVTRQAVSVLFYKGEKLAEEKALKLTC